MLARVLAMALCLSVCLSVCLSQVGVLYQSGWTNRAGFWHDSFLPPVRHCVQRKFGYLRKHGSPLGTSSQTPDLDSAASAYRSSKRVIELARQSGHSERDKLGRRRWTKLTIPRSICTAQFHRAGQLATAGTCYPRDAMLALARVLAMAQCKLGLPPVLFCDGTSRYGVPENLTTG